MTSVAATVIALAVLGASPGLDAGDRIPAFEVRDQNGTTRTFEDLRGRNGLALLFFRTADW